MTKTNAIIAYDLAVAANSDVTTIAHYLASADDKTRENYLRMNPAIAAQLNNLLKEKGYAN